MQDLRNYFVIRFVLFSYFRVAPHFSEWTSRPPPHCDGRRGYAKLLLPGAVPTHNLTCAARSVSQTGITVNGWNQTHGFCRASYRERSLLLRVVIMNSLDAQHRAFARGSVIKPQLRSMLIRACLSIEVSNFTNFLHHATPACCLQHPCDDGTRGHGGQRTAMPHGRESVTGRGQAGEVAAVRLACACDADDAGCVRWHNEGLVWQQGEANKNVLCQTKHVRPVARKATIRRKQTGVRGSATADTRVTRQSAQPRVSSANRPTKGNTKTRKETSERPQKARVRDASAQAFGSPKPSPSHPARVVCPLYV